MWMYYSESLGKLFCVYCKLFSVSTMTFANDGFDDWKHPNLIHQHETSKSHCEAARLYVRRSVEIGTIETQLTKQFKDEVQYWRDILKRVFDVVNFLASRGLPLRGSNQQLGDLHNGNYLGILELMSHYDPLLRSHFVNYANKGKGHVSYLSANVALEFVHLIANEVKKNIKGQIYRSKYYALVVDSTPDVAHLDQLTTIIRYVDENGLAKERFMEFIKNPGHKGNEMEVAMLSFFETNGFVIIDCRGQAYDTASNMSGKYKGLQAKIKQLSPLAVYIPCGGHVLNLSLCHTVESSDPATRFFMFVQSVYVFFSASTKKWALLITHLQHGLDLRGDSRERLLVPTRLCETRWSARADACLSLRSGYGSYISALEELSRDTDEK